MERDKLDGLKAGVRGTPTFFIGPSQPGDSITVGPLLVLSRDFGQAMFDTAANVSELMMVDAGTVTKLAPILKSAVECILGMEDVKLEVGGMVRFALPGHPLRPGLHVGIAATEKDVAEPDRSPTTPGDAGGE